MRASANAARARKTADTITFGLLPRTAVYCPAHATPVVTDLPGRLLTSTFRASRWLANRHLQTILANSILRRKSVVAMTRRRIELTDGDFLDLDIAFPRERCHPPVVVIVLHGLAGSSASHYVLDVVAATVRRGWTGLVMNFRGCSGVPNRLERSYHGGDTGDLRQVLGLIAQEEPQALIHAIGFSLGGNVLLKYLGEARESARIAAAAAISPPFRLDVAAATMERGLARFYRRRLIGDMQGKLRRKFESEDAPFDWQRAMGARSFLEFDDAVTAPLHGFASAEDYYRRSSCLPYLRSITTPTLIVHAEDDPFLDSAAIPKASDLSGSVTLELSRTGGHVGFLEAYAAGRPRMWLPERVLDFLQASLARPPSA